VYEIEARLLLPNPRQGQAKKSTLIRSQRTLFASAAARSIKLESVFRAINITSHKLAFRVAKQYFSLDHTEHQNKQTFIAVGPCPTKPATAPARDGIANAIVFARALVRAVHTPSVGRTHCNKNTALCWERSVQRASGRACKVH